MTGPPCPWCQTTEWSVERDDITDSVITSYDPNNGPIYYARCDCCGAQGPVVGWAADAVPALSVRTRQEYIDFCKKGDGE